jgi:hypothetical protein
MIPRKWEVVIGRRCTGGAFPWKLEFIIMDFNLLWKSDTTELAQVRNNNIYLRTGWARFDKATFSGCRAAILLPYTGIIEGAPSYHSNVKRIRRSGRLNDRIEVGKKKKSSKKSTNRQVYVKTK